VNSTSLSYTSYLFKDKHADASFCKRLALLDKEFPGAAVVLSKKGILPEVFNAYYS